MVQRARYPNSISLLWPQSTTSTYIRTAWKFKVKVYTFWVHGPLGEGPLIRRFRVWALGFRVWGSGSKGLGFRGLRFRV